MIAHCFSCENDIYIYPPSSYNVHVLPDFEAPAKDLAKQSGSKTVAQDNACWLRLCVNSRKGQLLFPENRFKIVKSKNSQASDDSPDAFRHFCPTAKAPDDKKSLPKKNAWQVARPKGQCLTLGEAFRKLFYALMP